MGTKAVHDGVTLLGDRCWNLRAVLGEYTSIPVGKVSGHDRVHGRLDANVTGNYIIAVH